MSDNIQARDAFLDSLIEDALEYISIDCQHDNLNAAGKCRRCKTQVYVDQDERLDQDYASRYEEYEREQSFKIDFNEEY